MRRILVFSLLFSAAAIAVAWPLACNSQPASRENGPLHFKLIQAFLCEDVREGTPYMRAVAFSVSRGAVCCYTLFDEIDKDNLVYHRWLSRDKPTARFKLSLKDPSWATFSSIQLRDADKGPWRVEIRDAGGQLLRALRFSVVD
jgi:hypothetical protein